MNPGCGSGVEILQGVIPLQFTRFRDQRTLLCTQSHQCITEQNILRSDSWVQPPWTCMRAASLNNSWSLPVCLTWYQKKKLSSCTTEDLAPYMYIPKGMKKCRQLSFSLSYFKWCNEEQSNTKPYFYSHHQSIFHICLFWTVEWYLRKHTHTHTH